MKWPSRPFFRGWNMQDEAETSHQDVVATSWAASQKPDMDIRFEDLAKIVRDFSHNFSLPSGLSLRKDRAQVARTNLEIFRVVFRKWTPEVLIVLTTEHELGFGALLRLLPGVSSRVLALRLKDLQRQGLVRREVLAQDPLRVQYSLTPRGRVLVDLAAPVFLFLGRELGQYR